MGERLSQPHQQINMQFVLVQEDLTLVFAIARASGQAIISIPEIDLAVHSFILHFKLPGISAPQLNKVLQSHSYMFQF